MNYKICAQCGEEKEGTEFYMLKGSLDGLNKRCKACCCINGRESRRKVTESMNLSNTKYSELLGRRQLDDAARRARLWRKKNRLTVNLRASIKRYFGGEYSKSTESILGCSIADANKHINGGEYGNYIQEKQIDHIIPISWASNYNESLLLSRIENFQWLPTHINQKKRDFATMIPKYIKPIHWKLYSNIIIRKCVEMDWLDELEKIKVTCYEK